MTNVNTAPQSVIDDQDPETATEPISITAEGDFGIVSWIPDEHAQDHLRELAEEGRLDGYLEFAKGEIGEVASTLGLALCADKDPTVMFLAGILGIFDVDGMPEPPML